MDGFISLTIFTVFAQAAAGMAMLMALCPNAKEEHKYSPWLVAAIVLLGIGTIASVFHLNNPFKSYLALSNFSSSFLSYEIYAVMAFGIALLASVFVKKYFVRAIAGVLGALLVYVMSEVYSSTSSITWSTPNTLVTFFTTSLLLGSVVLFAVKMISSSDKVKTATGCLPKLIAVALACRVISVALLVRASEVKADVMLLDLHLTLSVIASALLPIMLIQGIAKASKDGKQCSGFIYSIAMIVLILIGEMSGRMMYYMLYTNFGM